MVGGEILKSELDVMLGRRLDGPRTWDMHDGLQEVGATSDSKEPHDPDEATGLSREQARDK